MSNRKKWRKCVKYRSELFVNRKIDTVFESSWIRKFINILISGGVKSKAENIMYGLFYSIKSRIGEPLWVFFRTLVKFKWGLTTHTKRLAKFLHNVPTPIKFPRNITFGFSRMLMSLNSIISSDKSFKLKLFKEYQSILLNYKASSSYRIKKRRFRLIHLNRAYMHYRWK